MSIDHTDVVARLRAGADEIELHAFDAGQVVAGSRRALRRRRAWQAAGVGTTAVAVVFSLALAGPVSVPGLGDVALPGSEELRELFGLAEASESAGCAAPEPAVQRTADAEPVFGLRPAITFDPNDARPLSPCFDVRTDGVLADSAQRPETLTEDGALWRVSESGVEDELVLSYHVLGSTSGTGVGISGPNVHISSLVAQGRNSAWFEFQGATPEDLVSAPYLLRTATSAGGSVVTITEVPRRNTSSPTVTDQNVAWRQGTTVYIAPIDGSGPPEPVAHHASAVGGDDDEIVVATSIESGSEGWSTTFTSFGDDGSTTTVLDVELPGVVRYVDVSDDVLTYALDLGDLFALPRVDGTVDPATDASVHVRLDPSSVDGVSAAGSSVAWVADRVAYLLRDVGTSVRRGPDLVRLGQSGFRERMLVGLAGDRIAWNTTGPAGVRINVGTLLDLRETGITIPGPEVAGTSARAVPVAPTVTVPEDAAFHTYD
ncbi:hypothetical protein [Promicromonospora sp. NPDC019610]|uniref:hypothetical protein n=1 Tax=Promicromonospora sp. NPDC019610 TaxID=3364405 RepID=UPI0037B79EA3